MSRCVLALVHLNKPADVKGDQQIEVFIYMNDVSAVEI
jgi:hypothetical protein